LVTSHEQALAKRAEAEKVLTNYTSMVAKYKEQTAVAEADLADAKTAE